MRNIDPAFPFAYDGDQYMGISRRGFYAAHALAGFIANGDYSPEKCVAHALEAADELMAALEKKPEAP